MYVDVHGSIPGPDLGCTRGSANLYERCNMLRLIFSVLVLTSLIGPAAKADDVVKSGLLDIKEALLNNDIPTALAKVNELLALPPATPAPAKFKIFSSTRAVYYTTYGIQLSYPQCTGEDRRRAIQLAENDAMTACQNANASSCQITGSDIKKSGMLQASDIGETSSIDVYYSGCIGEASAKGFLN